MPLIVLLVLAALGTVVVLRTGADLDWAERCALAGVIAIAFATVVGSLLGWLGLFQWWSVGLAAGVPTLVVAASLTRSRGLRDIRRPTRAELIGLGSALAIVAVLLAVTPRWNFQIAYGMDAGNYEAYANYYEEVGTLYYEDAEAVLPGVPERWLPGQSTWSSSDGRPFYFPGYGALLGTAREALSGDLSSSSLVMGVVGLLNAALLFLLARRSGARPATAGLVSGLVTTTVMFFVYAKQMMSEQLALTGMLAFILALFLEDDEDRWFPAILAAAGASVLTISKLDGIVNIALTVVGLWAAVMLGLRWRGPTRRLAVSVGTSLVATTVFVSVVAVPSYVAKTSLAESIPPLAALPLSDLPLLIPMAVGSGVLLLHLALRRAPEPVTWHRHARRAALVAWVVFMLWNATVRPLGQTLENHDALNLVRLWSVTSPVLLVAVAIGAARDRRLPATARAVGVGLMVGFAWAVYSSQHTPADMWWMRRYLVVGSPLLLLGGVGLVAMVAAADVRRRIVTTGLLLLVVAQTTRLVPFLDYEQNSAAPGRLTAIESVLPTDAPLVIIDGERVVESLGVTLASRRDGPTLNRVSLEEIGTALDLIDVPGTEFVLSPRLLRPQMITAQGLEQIAEGRFSAQWSDWYRDVLLDPDAERRARKYWLYARPADS